MRLTIENDPIRLQLVKPTNKMMFKAATVLALASAVLATPFMAKQHFEAMRTGGYVAPGEGDSRGPCPMLNTLANHGYLPHDGRDISTAQFVEALTSVLNMDASLANTLASGAVSQVGANGRIAALVDLSKHNAVEHDVSLSRVDYNRGQGNNNDLNPELFQELLSSASDGTFLTIQDIAKLRARRYREAKAADIDFKFGIKEATVADGEAALILNIMGNQFLDASRDHKVPVTYLQEFFGNERFPEEWTTPAKPVTNTNMLSTAAKIARLAAFD